MTPWIATLWVSPTHRRQGWATRLLKEALELAAAASPTGKIHLWTHTQALESNLYGPAGFVVIERLDHRGAPAAIMAAPVVG
jgi:ribosomal protein S18 acetylase RimI-like enzyme